MKSHTSSPRLRSGQAGQASRVLIILAIVVLVAIVIVYFGIKFATSRKTTPTTSTTNSSNPNEPAKPVYVDSIGDVEFSVETAQDLGGFIPAKASYQRDLTTTEKFIKVTVGAKNTGKVSTEQYAWDIGNIIDSAGRIFPNIDNKAYYFLPQPDLCGAVLKPDFSPIPCIKMYEVSKESTGLKIEAIATNSANKKNKTLLDLNVTK